MNLCVYAGNRIHEILRVINGTMLDAVWHMSGKVKVTSPHIRVYHTVRVKVLVDDTRQCGTQTIRDDLHVTTRGSIECVDHPKDPNSSSGDPPDVRLNSG